LNAKLIKSSKVGTLTQACISNNSCKNSSLSSLEKFIISDSSFTHTIATGALNLASNSFLRFSEFTMSS
jgi:hypothetical protein